MKEKFILKSLITLSIALIMFLSVTGCSQKTIEKAEGSLLLNVNPEIEIKYDKKGLVLDIEEKNDDAKALQLNDEEYKNKECKYVLPKIIEKIKENGYFNNKFNGHAKNIVIKPTAKSSYPAKSFLSDIKNELNASVNNLKIHSNAIVIENKDLDDRGYIGIEKAKEIVMKQLEITNAKFADHEYKLEDGVYEFEFTSDGIEYEYEVDATTGKVLEADIENNDDWDDKDDWDDWNETDIDDDDDDQDDDRDNDHDDDRDIDDNDDDDDDDDKPASKKPAIRDKDDDDDDNDDDDDVDDNDRDDDNDDDGDDD